MGDETQYAPPALDTLTIDLGELTKKQIKQLRRGVGPEAERVSAAIKSSLRSKYSDLPQSSETEIIPVLLLYPSPGDAKERQEF